ncbi:MAG: hypothetical protein QW666_00870 [Candidatus Woesearchaeota archaeon]
MVTLLDTGLLQKFDIIFPFLLVLTLVYVGMNRISWFKDKQAFCFIIAFALALLTIFSRVAVRTINMMAPWFVLLFIFMILVLMAYMAFGIKEETIIETITKGKYATDFGYWVLALVLIIGLGSLATVISEEKGFMGLAGEEAAGAAEKISFWTTITHPKILGLALLMLVALFTIQKLAAKN